MKKNKNNEGSGRAIQAAGCRSYPCCKTSPNLFCNIANKQQTIEHTNNTTIKHSYAVSAKKSSQPKRAKQYNNTTIQQYSNTTITCNKAENMKQCTFSLASGSASSFLSIMKGKMS